MDDNVPADQDSSSKMAYARPPLAEKQGRKTTRKTPEQIARLTAALAQNPRPDRKTREELVLETGLTFKIISTWFRDKRSESKKLGIPLEGSGVGPIRQQRSIQHRARPQRRARSVDSSSDESDDEESAQATRSPAPATPPPRVPEIVVAPSKAESPNDHGHHQHHHHHEWRAAYPSPSQRSVVVAESYRDEPGKLPFVDRSPHFLPHPDSVFPPQAKAPSSPLVAPPSPAVTAVDEFSDASSNSSDEEPYQFWSPKRTSVPVPSPMQAPVTLPSIDGEASHTFPSVAIPIRVPENGWTSSWRWTNFGHESGERWTLRPCKIRDTDSDRGAYSPCSERDELGSPDHDIKPLSLSPRMDGGVIDRLNRLAFSPVRSTGHLPSPSISSPLRSSITANDYTIIKRD